MNAADLEPIQVEELRDAWPALSRDERVESFRLVPHGTAQDFFESLNAAEKRELLEAMQPQQRRAWMRLLEPDDAVDVIQSASTELRPELLASLDDPSRKEVQALLMYAEDVAGGLMNPRFARLRPEMSADEALAYLRRQTRTKVETLYYLYVIDPTGRLVGVVSLRQLLRAPPDARVADIMEREVVALRENTEQEDVSRLFSRHPLLALPVLDDGGRMKGIVTLDDIVDVVQEEATEDIQKVGGMEALDAPYFEVTFFDMLRKRAGWLMILFVGEMLTATAMGYFEKEIARAVVLALFVPLIISSGGNSGSQATTLVIRAMALREIRLVDVFRVARREVAAGLSLGVVLGTVGLTRILVWEAVFHTYGEHAVRIALTVAASLVGVVMWGTLSGAMLPFLLRRLGFDPASASAPFVATLVDVSGLVIYFTTASVLLRGTLL